MKKISPLDPLLENGTFRFEKLTLKHIDNSPVIKDNAPDIVDQETCLFHLNIRTGDDYFSLLHQMITQGLSKRKSTPVVRFADGEYAFYNYDLSCNGLYRQAESIGAIRKAMPSHISAFKMLNESGKLAPLIFPKNITCEERGIFSIFRRARQKSSVSTFLAFLFQNAINLSEENYIPFYVVYAYLISKDFSGLVDQKKICILNSEFNRDSCTQWFERLSSCPDLSSAEIPAEYVATRWETMREDVLKQIPFDTDLCLVGAGAGALLVCMDVAKRFSIPAIDAGHILNMMNHRLDKSNGARLYTIRKMEKSN